MQGVKRDGAPSARGTYRRCQWLAVATAVDAWLFRGGEIPSVSGWERDHG